MADRLREELSIEAELVRGRGGVFVVSVNGACVARKTYEGFPSPEEVVEAVRAALEGGA